MNLDPRSARINTEIGLRIDCPSFAAEVAAALDRTASPQRSWALAIDARGRITWREGDRVLGREPRAGWARRLLAFVVRLLPVHHWL
jgi:putative cardiolipin synthase